MKRLRITLYVFALAVAVLFMVILSAAENGWSNLSINHDIDPVNLAILCVNLFVAFSLQTYFVARTADDRAEKDILIDNARDVFNMLRTCRDEVHASRGTGKITIERQKQINKAYRNLANGLDNLETALEMSGCKELTKECDSVSDEYYKYKAAATGKFPHAYDPSDIGYQDQTYRALNRALHALAFKVNQHR